MDDHDEDPAAALLAALLKTDAKPLPASAAGRLLRLAGTAARTGATFGWNRLRGAPALDAEAAERLALRLGQLKGLAMKAGQFLSYVDDSMLPEVRRALAGLQTHSPAVPFVHIETALRKELDSATAEMLLARIDHQPVAAASIGQVHRAWLADGRAVAVKVQYPGIEDALQNEFAAAGAGARIANLMFPGGGIDGFLAEARERILAECDYHQEAIWQQRFGHAFSDHATLRVPEMIPECCAAHVLTTIWHDGQRFESWLEAGPTQAQRDRIGIALYEFYLGSLLREGLFNCDPHPGNYLFAADGGLIMLDYGCVRAFTPQRVQQLIALRRAVQCDEPSGLRDALRKLGAAGQISAAGYDTARALLRAFFVSTLDDRVQTIPSLAGTGMAQLLANKRALAALGLPGDLLFLFRIKFGLHAVLARIGAQANWRRLEDSWS